MGNQNQMDWGGMTLVCNDLNTGSSNPGNAGSAASTSALSGVTAGTVTASKAVVVDANRDIGTFRHVTLNGNLVTGSTTLSEAELGVLDSADNTNTGTGKAVILGTSGALAIGGTATLANAANIAVNTSTGTKIGTATSQKLGFWNATPVIQQASAAQAAVTPSTSFTGADTVDKATVLAAVQAVETLVNRLRLDLVTTGVIKGAA